MFEKETTNKDPEKLVEDFKKCLRERAINHSQFYHRLSNAPIVALKTQSKQNISDDVGNSTSKTVFHHRFCEKNNNIKDYENNNENFVDELNEMKIIISNNNDIDIKNNNKIDNKTINIDTNGNTDDNDYNNDKNEVEISKQSGLCENILNCSSINASNDNEKLKIITAPVSVVTSKIENYVIDEKKNVMCNLLSNDDEHVLKLFNNSEKSDCCDQKLIMSNRKLEMNQISFDDDSVHDDMTILLSNVETNQDFSCQYFCCNMNKSENKNEIISSIEFNEDKNKSSDKFDKKNILNTVHTTAIDQSINKLFTDQNVSTDNKSNKSSIPDNGMLIRKVNVDNGVVDSSGNGGVISKTSNHLKSLSIGIALDDDDNDNRQRRRDNNGFKFKSFNFNNYNVNMKKDTTTESNVMLASTSNNKNIVNTSEKIAKCDHKYSDYSDENSKSLILMANKNLNNNNNSNNNNNDKKNKMNEGEEWNDSNCFTFIPLRSFDDDRLDRTARWCRSRDITAEQNSNNSNSSANKNIELDVKEQYFQRYLQDTEILSTSNILSKDQNLNEDCYNNYNKKDSIVNYNFIRKESENRIKFPCVEKLVKMYTKLLQDKKNEDSMEIKAEENETNIKQKCDDESNKCKSEEKNEQNNNLKLKPTVDRLDLNRISPVSDEGCPVGQSPYSSDYDDNESAISKNIETETETENIQNKDKVMRSSSSDSALGLDDECQGTERPASPPPPSANTGRRMTLTVADIPLRPALLPLAEPTNLPDSPTSTEQYSSPVGALLTQTAVPSKVLLEERVVEIPEDRFGSLSSSRRESAQSCFSDYNSEYGGVRYVRTPSVVVSDYSDDVMCGITLEEIEYFRAHRMRRRSSADTAATEKDDTASDISAASSCSNLYYCGSTISALDGADCYVNGMRMPTIDRKISDCSTCSTASGEEDDEHYFSLSSDYSQQHNHHHNHQDNLFVEQQQQQHQVEQQIQQKRKHKKVGEQIPN